MVRYQTTHTTRVLDMRCNVHSTFAQSKSNKRRRKKKQKKSLQNVSSCIFRNWFIRRYSESVFRTVYRLKTRKCFFSEVLLCVHNVVTELCVSRMTFIGTFVLWLNKKKKTSMAAPKHAWQQITHTFKHKLKTFLTSIRDCCHP